MPRGIPNKKRGGRRAAAEIEEDVVGGELDDTPAPVTNGLGAAIESVRSALEPFSKETRKKIVQAASVMLR